MEEKEEKKETVKLHIDLPKRLHHVLKITAAVQEMSIKQIVIETLSREYLPPEEATGEFEL